MLKTTRSPEGRPNPIDLVIPCGDLEWSFDGLKMENQFEFYAATSVISNLPRKLADKRAQRRSTYAILNEAFSENFLLEATGRAWLLNNSTIGFQSFTFENGSIVVRAKLVIGVTAALYTGIATYPTFKEGVTELYSDLKMVLEAVEDEYREVVTHLRGQLDQDEVPEPFFPKPDLPNGPNVRRSNAIRTEEEIERDAAKLLRRPKS